MKNLQWVVINENILCNEDNYKNNTEECLKRILCTQQANSSKLNNNQLLVSKAEEDYDNNKKIYDSNNRLIELNDYSILKHDGDISLFKRVNINNNEMWIKENKSVLYKLIEQEKQKCNLESEDSQSETESETESESEYNQREKLISNIFQSGKTKENTQKIFS